MKKLKHIKLFESFEEGSEEKSISDNNIKEQEKSGDEIISLIKSTQDSVKTQEKPVLMYTLKTNKGDLTIRMSGRNVDYTKDGKLIMLGGKTISTTEEKQNLIVKEILIKTR